MTMNNPVMAQAISEANENFESNIDIETYDYVIRGPSDLKYFVAKIRVKFEANNPPKAGSKLKRPHCKFPMKFKIAAMEAWTARRVNSGDFGRCGLFSNTPSDWRKQVGKIQTKVTKYKKTNPIDTKIRKLEAEKKIICDRLESLIKLKDTGLSVEDITDLLG